MLDANLPIYAYDSASPYYPLASQWLKDVMHSGEQIGVPFQTVLAFIRVTTSIHLGVYKVSAADALAAVDAWFERPQVSILSLGSSHWDIFRRLYLQSQATARLSTDVHIAALTIEHDAVLHTADRDFARFPGLRWINPIQAQ